MWEYQVFYAGNRADFGGASLKDFLNAKGREGWKLHSISFQSSGDVRMVILERNS